MDNPQKKRSFLGSFSFWGRNPTTIPTDPEQRAEFYRTADLSHTPPIPRVGFNASPESPAKRASSTQLSSRKILDKPQGPSSKLSQSISASDLSRFPSTNSTNNNKTTNFSASTTTIGPSRPVTRMPGDNPNKPPNSIGGFTATVRRPYSSSIPPSASTPRNLFRSSAMNSSSSRPGFAFSPKVPSTTINQSFPPTTPGRPPRGSTAEVSGRSLSGVNTASLFSMRIPSPPPDLTGERLAKEVPENHNRAGSIYADEFLTDFCPSDFDDLQRRQFFCILDLRRLKYAADEVFARKDWKINILNFAKEYEKSRSLIMLRYGLYEFKTVKASEAIKKQWQRENGIPGSDDEQDEAPAYKPNGTQGILSRTTATGKRKAEEELAPPKDSPSKKSANPGNKRRAMEHDSAPPSETTSFPSPSKAKRKAAGMSDDADESQPSKLHKSAAPAKPNSSVKSLFESIANGTSSHKPAADAHPIKQPSRALGDPKPAPSTPSFSSSTKPANGNQTPSVFAQGGQPAATNNIFGHLSDASKGSGNDDADAESETSTDSDGEAEDDEEESEARDASQGDDHSAAPSGGATAVSGTPAFGGPTHGIFGKKAADDSGPSDAGEAAKGKSLFDRVTYGTDGQPVRMLPPQAQEPKEAPEETETTASAEQPPVSPPKEPAAAPTNNTWNTDTPIKFTPAPAAPSPSVFGSTAQKPAFLFAKEATSTAAPPSMFATAPAPSSPAKPTEESRAPSSHEAPSSAAPQSLFAKSATPFSSHAKPAFAPPAQAKAPDAAPLVPSAMPSFGQQPPADAKKEAAPPAPASSSSLSLFGAVSKPSEPETSKPAAAAVPVLQSSTLFGNAAKSQESKPSPQPPATPLFGAATPKAPEPAAPASQPTSFFEGATSKSAGSSIFASSGATPAASTPASSQPPSKSLFGGTANNSQPSSSFFGAAAAKPPASESTGSMFGNTSAAPASKSLFGAAAATPTTTTTSQDEPAKSQPSSIFANPSATTSAAPSGGLFSFGGGSQNAPAFAANSQQSVTQPNSGASFGGAGSSFTFTAGGAEQPAFSNPFATNGTSSAPPSFDFGNNSANDAGSQAPGGPFVFGGGGATATPSITFGGASGSSTPAPPPGPASGAASFTFGADASQPAGSSIFAQPKAPNAAGSIFGGLAPPAGGTSTDTPFTFGGASSLATTPATGTPEPAAPSEGEKGTQADGDDAPQEQLSLTEGGPGEEDESVVHEVRTKALKLEVGKGSDSESGKDNDNNNGKNSKSPWKVQGLGPLRVLKHNASGAVRMLLRGEPRGHVALNKLVLSDFSYQPEPTGGKHIKVVTSNDQGTGLETWLLQVKTKEAAQALADVLEANKGANKKS